jgi:hypothetical protein
MRAAFARRAALRVVAARGRGRANEVGAKITAIPPDERENHGGARDRQAWT